MRKVARLAALGLLGLMAASTVVLSAAPAGAHPLGNFTINQYSGLRIAPTAVTVDLVTDMAEIPTFQTKGQIDTNHDGNVDDAEATRWRTGECRAQAAKISLALDGRNLPVTVTPAGSLTFPPGQAGLVTLRLECALVAELTGTTTGRSPHSVSYRNSNFDGRLGWREITAAADPGVTLASSDVATTSVSARLTRYPADLLRSPLAERVASIQVDLDPQMGNSAAVTAPSSESAKPSPPTILPRGVDRATRAFTSLVARRHFTVAFGLLAVTLAVLLGAIHALAPGHGKTVTAAYLVGQRGSFGQAVLIGLTVTATHTAGVLTLGVVLTTSAVVAPERLYPWLGVASGLLLAGIGASLLARWWRGRRILPADGGVPLTTAPARAEARREVRALVGAGVAAAGAPSTVGVASEDQPLEADAHGHGHAHPHGHEHPHRHDDSHTHAHHHGGRAHSHPVIDRPTSRRSLLAMGFAGGMVPSPSALVVLLGAIALGRAWFGLVLVVAYGVGMAAMLTGVGLLLVRARALIDRRARRRVPGFAVLTTFLPAATAALIVVGGIVLAARGVAKV